MIYQRLARDVLLPLLDLCGSTHVAEYWKILERTQWLKREKIADLQQERMRRLLKHAYENVPYYHKVFRERGLTPSDIRTVEDLKKLPILRKAHIRSTPQELTSRNLSRREIIPCQTSGTTATPMKFYKTKEDISWGTAAWLRAHRWGNYELGDKLAVILAFEPPQFRNPLFRITNLFQRKYVLLNTYEASEASIVSSAEKMENLRPWFLMGSTSIIPMLANYLSTERRSTSKLKAIFTMTDPLLASQRKLTEKVFRCEVYDCYCSSEFSLMASECGSHSGYHIQSENVVLEFVKDGDQVSPGETGTILVTSLNNYAMPFMRYDIGDMGKPSEDSCPCGRGLPLFGSLEGRTREYLLTGDGAIVYLKDLDIFFEGLPVKMFQIVQRERDEVLVRVVKADGYSEKDTNFIKRNIAWNPRKTTKVNVEIVETIPSEVSGKKRYIVNKLDE